MRYLVLLLLSLLMLSACGGTPGTAPDPSPQPNPVPTPTEVGQPLGEPVTTTIGSSGGTLASADGVVTLSVPAGAVSQEAAFSVQEITNFAPGKISKAYRLSPKGGRFAQPVTLRFKLSEAEVGVSPADSLAVAYQTSEGYWVTPDAQSYDAASRTLTVTTSHFSDWSPVAGAQLDPWAARVKVGKSVELNLQICDKDETLPLPMPNGTEEYFYACSSNAVLSHVVRNWSVNGVAGGNASVGTITQTSPGHAVYTAPAKKPGSNPVAVSVQYNALNGGVVTLVANITVEDDAGEWQGTITYHEEGSRPWNLVDGFEGSGLESFQQNRTYKVVGVKEVDGPSTTLLLQESSSAVYTNNGHMEKKVYEICQAFGPVILRHHFIYDVQEQITGEASRTLEARLYIGDDGAYSLAFYDEDVEMNGSRAVIDIYKDGCAETVNDRSHTKPVKTYADTGRGIRVEGAIDPTNSNVLKNGYDGTGEGYTVPTNIRVEWNLSKGQ